MLCRERLTRENTEFEAQLMFVSDAVMAFAHAVRDLHRWNTDHFVSLLSWGYFSLTQLIFKLAAVKSSKTHF